jgi:hypothetical protein
MADSTIALATNGYPAGVDNTQRRQVVYGTLTITAAGGTAPATGIPINWSTITDSSSLPANYFQPQVSSSTTQPAWVEFMPGASSATPKQIYTYDATNNSIVVWAAGSPIVTGILADVVNFKAEWIRGV